MIVVAARLATRPDPASTADPATAGGRRPSLVAPMLATTADWLRRIDRLRAEDRPAEAARAGWAAFAVVPESDRRLVLRALTLALLADVPDDEARDALGRRLDADPADLDARVALLLRDADPAAPPADRPRLGRPSPSAADRVAALRSLVATAPDHPGARLALASALLDLGRIADAAAILDGLPEADRDDPRALRLRARLDLDHHDRPDRAAALLRRLLDALPHDWQDRARLARALERLGDPDGARHQASLVDRHREALDPSRLGPRLADDLGRLDDSAALRDLSDLSASVGLDRLAAAWRAEADAAP